MGYYNMESISNLLLAAKGVAIIKILKQTFEFGQSLYKLYIIAKL